MPGNGDAFFNLLAVIRMYFLALRNHRFNALFLGHARKGHAVAVIIGSKDDALGFVYAMWRVPDLANRLIGPADAAEDALLLPETFLRLESPFVGCAAADVFQGLHVIGRQIVLDATHEMAGDAVETVVGFDGLGLTVLAILDGNPFVRQIGAQHKGAIFDLAFQLTGEPCRDAIHAARGLHQHRAGFALVVTDDLPRGIGPQQIAHINHVFLHGVRNIVAGGIACTGAAREAVVRTKVAEGTDHVHDQAGFFVGERLIKLQFCHGFGHQLGHEATHIGGELGVANGLAAHDRVVLYPGHLVFVDEELEVDTQLLAVMQDVAVGAGNAGSAGIEEHVGLVVPLTVLGIADLVDEGTGAHGEDAATRAVRSFQHGAVITSFAEFVGNGESGNSGAQNDDFAILVAQPEKIRNRSGSTAGDHAQSPGNTEDCGSSARGGDQIQEFSSGNWI